MRATNKPDVYDVIGPYVVEMYDQAESQREDVDLILSLVKDVKKRILEPFCGHGRILIPLAEAGHDVMGIDHSRELLKALAQRCRRLPEDVQERISAHRADALSGDWPDGFDVIVLGGNCLYELANIGEQERCIALAGGALTSGGSLYLDNNHTEGSLDPAWMRPGVHQGVFPTGICRDGTRLQGTMETVAYDANARWARFRRTATITSPDGRVETRTWIQQKHAPSTDEMTAWLHAYGFRIEFVWGDRRRTSYTADTDRAVFWAVKR